MHVNNPEMSIRLTRPTRGSSTTSETRRWRTRETARGEASKGTRRRRATDTSSGTTKSNGQATTSGLADTRAGSESGSSTNTRTGGAETRRRIGRRGTINGARNDLGTANDGETKSTLLLSFNQWGV